LHAALHQQAEGIGLAWGFYGVPDPQTGPLAGAGRLMRDENIAAALAPLGIDVDGAPGDATFADFVSDPEGYAEAVEEIESVIADVFGLTATDLNAFRNPPPEGG